MRSDMCFILHGVFIDEVIYNTGSDDVIVKLAINNIMHTIDLWPFIH